MNDSKITRVRVAHQLSQDKKQVIGTRWVYEHSTELIIESVLCCLPILRDHSKHLCTMRSVFTFWSQDQWICKILPKTCLKSTMSRVDWIFTACLRMRLEIFWANETHDDILCSVTSHCFGLIWGHLMPT